MSYRVKLRVKELLEEEGITQKKLAEMAGVREFNNKRYRERHSNCYQF